LLAGAALFYAGPARADTFDNYANGGSTTFHSLGFLPSSTLSQALGVSADGRYVVGYSIVSGSQQAFSLQINYPTQLGGPVSFGPLVSLGNLGGPPASNILSVANAASDTGLAVGQSASSSGLEGFLVTTAGSGQQALPRASSGLVPVTALGINRGGTTIVGQARTSSSPNTNDAAMWQVNSGVVSPNSATILPNYGPPNNPAGGYAAAARGITTDASVVVGQGVRAPNGANQRTEATYWTVNNGTPGVATELGFAPNLATVPNSIARAVSENGSSLAPGAGFVAVGNSSGLSPDPTPVGVNSEAAAWSVNSSFLVTARGLGYVGPTQSAQFFSQANGVSASKPYLTTVVGASSSSNTNNVNPATGREAFTMVLGDGSSPVPVMQSLKDTLNAAPYSLSLPDGPTGWKLVEATAVSADGNTIVGWGINPAGNQEAWVVILATPEPGSFMLVGIGALVLTRRRSRRRAIATSQS